MAEINKTINTWLEVWEKGNPHSMWVKLQSSTVTLDISVKNSQRPKDKSTISPCYNALSTLQTLIPVECWVVLSVKLNIQGQTLQGIVANVRNFYKFLARYWVLSWKPYFNIIPKVSHWYFSLGFLFPQMFISFEIFWKCVNYSFGILRRNFFPVYI